MSSCKNDKSSTITDHSAADAHPDQPDSGSGTGTENKQSLVERRQIFQPALSIQRYQWVQSFLEKRDDIRSITDVGCGNGRMLLWLKSIRHLESIKLLDKDSAELEPDFNSHLQPALWDMVFGRKECDKPLRVEVYHGDLTEPNEALRSDCFTLVEVVEHLEPQMVERCVRVVFEYYRPKLVIVTTPNNEFNHLLRSGPNESADTFRHSDHKFEWTRAQFQQWCESVSKRLNNSYEYHLYGVGHLSNSEPFGPCTQIAAFTRLATKQDEEEDHKQQAILFTSQITDPPKRTFERVLDYEIPATKSCEAAQEENSQEESEISYESW